ncbi:ATP-binding protein [Natronosalvus vescus]|uniref:ATP-binding protein n=1 Tax=Natronosalvus vescus TaxID=2953881 RepID=UPI002090430C|nr:ATP-binding protein [Natronosalvus vescus]
MNVLFVGYLLLFGLSALVCVLSVRRSQHIPNRETRRGLTWLLWLSGGWATAHVGYLIAPTAGLAELFYLVGLVIGIATVGPWLYFCSAFTGRSLHLDTGVRRAAVVVFLGIVAVKLTNPIHGWYYTAELATTPFPHLEIGHLPLHWVVMGLAYALSFVGFFILLELFSQLSHDTRPLVVVLALTGAPVALDLYATTTPILVETTHSAVGVAFFAVGMLYVYLDSFETIRLAAAHDDPIVVIDSAGRIADYNDDAELLFSELHQNAINEPLEAILPAVGSVLDTERAILERGSPRRYYRITASPFGAGSAEGGRILTVDDVTDQEQYRQKLERQNDRLESFASMISHDLRNPLSVAKGHLELARAEPEEATEHLEIVAESHDRMEALIEDVLALARQGQPIDDKTTVSLEVVANDCWSMVSTAGASLELDVDSVDRVSGRLFADPDRLQQLLENLFRNAVEHGSTSDSLAGARKETTEREHGNELDTHSTASVEVTNENTSASGLTIRVGLLEDGRGFYVEDDGVGIPESNRQLVFDSGYSTAQDGTGFGLAIASEIVDAHEWSIEVTAGTDGGARFEISGVEFAS